MKLDFTPQAFWTFRIREKISLPGFETQTIEPAAHRLP
jgi:hypothetical protein